MLQAMAAAEVGDDVFREDPTVNQLQEKAAELFGKEAALFVPSGTMGNQIAVKLHTRPGQEVITEARGHIYNWEMATMAAFSGCLARPIHAEQGILRWNLIEPSLSPQIYYRAQTGLVTLENTHNMAGGTVMSQGDIQEVCTNCHERNLPVHMDGARIFNAAAVLETSVADLARECDSVMFCLSKGLSAPIGSLLVGRKDFIEAAWPVRKMMGGGMRQVGLIAAAGLIALETMPERLHDDHRNAGRLAEGLAEKRAFSVDLDTVQTNIVIADLVGFSTTEFLATLAGRGVMAVATGPEQVRFVTHKDVSRTDVDQALKVIGEIVS
jgi:threonine aldolase